MDEIEDKINELAVTITTADKTVKEVRFNINNLLLFIDEETELIGKWEVANNQMASGMNRTNKFHTDKLGIFRKSFVRKLNKLHKAASNFLNRRDNRSRIEGCY